MITKKSKETKTLIAFSLASVGLISSGIASMVGKYNEYHEEMKSYFKYSKNENGEYIPTGTIEYCYFEYCWFIQIENDSTNTDEFYICKKYQVGDITYYINILNPEIILKSGENCNRKLVNEIDIIQCICRYNGFREEYTPEDVKSLLERIKEGIKEENKVLVKTKFNTNDVTKVNL